MNILIRSMSSRAMRSEEHTSELQSLTNLVCRLLLEKKKKTSVTPPATPPHPHPPSRLYPPVSGQRAGRSRMVLSPRVMGPSAAWSLCFFFFNDTATTEIYTLSLHDALPIYWYLLQGPWQPGWWSQLALSLGIRSEEHTSELQSRSDLVCRLLLEKKKKT